MKKLFLLLFLITNLVMADDLYKKGGLSCFGLNSNGQISIIDCQSGDCEVSSPTSSLSSSGAWTVIEPVKSCWTVIEPVKSDWTVIEPVKSGWGS